MLLEVLAPCATVAYVASLVFAKWLVGRSMGWNDDHLDVERRQLLKHRKRWTAQLGSSYSSARDTARFELGHIDRRLREMEPK
jgi:hypothetical protein